MTSTPETTRIGKLEFSVEVAPPTTPVKREKRAEALTAWLLQRWQLERQEQQHVQTESAA